MAGSRLEKFGNIFSRLSGLLKSGAIKSEDKPIWYDVYETFPPDVEPEKLRPMPNFKVKSILYPEDVIRAKFYKNYGSPGIIDMINSLKSSPDKNICQQFIVKYNELKAKNPNLSENEIFQTTQDIMNKENFNISNVYKNIKRDKDVKIDIKDLMRT